jgi:hypothetical protein
MMPKNHISINRDNFASRAKSVYRAPDNIEVEKRKLEIERNKIKNLIGNNPFKVRNYVQGDDLNNDLMPQKLLKDKKEDFDNDEEFIEYFVKKIQQRKKNEKSKLSSHKQSISMSEHRPLESQMSINVSNQFETFDKPQKNETPL